ncbi:unnamed protein product [Bursaphelenchus okinawaensis]|uniref:Uncharacterized protein n=1 Tax=Bursaphelenchus okinawaensis TaxID=465554 RepID=A0A811KV22_9BILA|nr:unnamed protein product [Bursaphelenchus okinawaensis]CAG9112431.1 unnamed protein product [Bursaphelenchus okinawaensis]
MVMIAGRQLDEVSICGRVLRMKWFKCLCHQKRTDNTYESLSTAFTNVTLKSNVRDESAVEEGKCKKKHESHVVDWNQEMLNQRIKKERYEKQCLRERLQDAATLNRNLVVYAKALEEENKQIARRVTAVRKTQMQLMQQLKAGVLSGEVRQVSI